MALNIAPLNAPHKSLEWLPLADKDYQMMETVELCNKYHIETFSEIRRKHKSNADVLGIWESKMPVYYLPQVNAFPDLIHQCCENYDPNQRAVLAPSGSVLFHVIPQAINQMLNFETTRPLVPLSMKLLLDQGAKLSSSEITRIAQLFMQPYCQPRQPPPYLHVWFNETGRILVDMISCILGFNTSEFFDETVLVLLSMFAPGQPPVVQYD